MRMLACRPAVRAAFHAAAVDASTSACAQTPVVLEADIASIWCLWDQVQGKVNVCAWRQVRILVLALALAFVLALLALAFRFALVSLLRPISLSPLLPLTLALVKWL